MGIDMVLEVRLSVVDEDEIWWKSKSLVFFNVLEMIFDDTMGT